MKTKTQIFFLLLCCLLFFSGISAWPSASISMDFEDVELKVLIRTMSEILEKNFIISSSVEGRVSISAPQKVTPEQALNMLKSVLLVHGFTLIEKEGTFEVVNAEDAKNIQENVSHGRTIPEDLLKSRHVITHLIRLEYAEAEEVKKILSPLISRGGYVGSGRETNTIIMTGDSANIQKLLSLINQIDQSGPAKGRNNLEVIKCNHISSLDAAEMLEKLYASKLRLAGRTEGTHYPSFIAHEESNSLLISANSAEIEKIARMLKNIDIPKKQVLVKAVVAEISEQTAKEIGFDILSTGGVLYATQKGFTKISEGGMGSALLSGADADGIAVSYADGIHNFNGKDIPDISWVVSLSQQHEGIDIISTPKLLTADNEEAEIIVGQNLAFLKDSQVTPQGGTVKTFDFKDVGLILKIKPRISSSDIITLSLSQTLEEVIGSSFEGGLETSKRSINTTVILKDNSLIVIGGLTADRKDDKLDKTPFFGDIPIIGYLFQKKSKSSGKRNLLLFISAQIVRTPEEMDSISREESQTAGIYPE